MTEAIFTVVVFAVPVLVVGIIKQRKRELEHKKRVLVLLQESSGSRERIERSKMNEITFKF